MGKKVKAVKKTAENPSEATKIRPTHTPTAVGALGHAEYWAFPPQDLQDAGFFKAAPSTSKRIRLHSDQYVQLFTVGYS
jgi:hypothetical protein